MRKSARTIDQELLKKTGANLGAALAGACLLAACFYTMIFAIAALMIFHFIS
jgi:hypothetical protein